MKLIYFGLCIYVLCDNAIGTDIQNIRSLHKGWVEQIYSLGFQAEAIVSVDIERGARYVVGATVTMRADKSARLLDSFTFGDTIDSLLPESKFEMELSGI